MARADYRARIYDSYASAFQGSAAQFDPKAARQRVKAYTYFFRGWLPEDKNAAIADVGCGSGALLHCFKTLGYSDVRGADISPEQVGIASQAVPDVVHEDAVTFLDRHTGAFDLITGMDILEHFGKDEVLPFLDACWAGLKPGGRLILQTPNGDSPFVNSVRYGDFSHEICFTARSLAHLLKLARFQDIEARDQGPIPWGYSLKSTIRFLLWQALRCGLIVWNVVETGAAGGGVSSRVFLASARKPSV